MAVSGRDHGRQRQHSIEDLSVRRRLQTPTSDIDRRAQIEVTSLPDPILVSEVAVRQETLSHKVSEQGGHIFGICRSRFRVGDDIADELGRGTERATGRDQIQQANGLEHSAMSVIKSNRVPGSACRSPTIEMHWWRRQPSMPQHR